MDTLKAVADSIPFVKRAAREIGVDPAYCLGVFVLLAVILIQKTALGAVISCILSIYFPVREAILSIQSPAPKVAEQRKLLVVFIAFAAFTMLEAAGARRIIPLFGILKIAGLFWLGYDERHANTFYEVAIKKIPQKWLNCGDTIESAVKKAAKAVEEKKVSVSSESSRK